MIGFYQYDKEAPLDCPACRWSGRGEDGDVNLFNDLFDVRCPGCDAMLLIVGYPTVQETREQARRGNVEAKRALADLEQRNPDA